MEPNEKVLYALLTGDEVTKGRSFRKSRVPLQVERDFLLQDVDEAWKVLENFFTLPSWSYPLQVRPSLHPRKVPRRLDR